MSTKVWTVQGMTCEHCVKAVTDEISIIIGVSDVAVDLTTGKVTVTSEVDPPVELLAAAVDEAGYTLVTT
jgi:copper chaperone CopZ